VARCAAAERQRAMSGLEFIWGLAREELEYRRADDARRPSPPEGFRLAARSTGSRERPAGQRASSITCRRDRTSDRWTAVAKSAGIFRRSHFRKLNAGLTLGLADLVAEPDHRWQGRQTGRFVHRAFVEAKHFAGFRGHT
jgi:hypothetical protein